MMPALRSGAAAAALCVASIWGLATAVYTPPTSTINVRKKFWRPSAGPATNVIKIGTPVTLNQDARYASLGGALFNAWVLYFDWLNRERGGVRVGGTNYSVELILLDDMSSTDTVEWATDYLIQQEGVSHFLGPYSSGLTGRMAPLVQAAGKVAIAPGASLTSVFQPHSNVFGTLTPNNKFLIGAIQAVGAADGGSRKTLIYLSEDKAWTNSTCAEVPRLAALNNMQLLSEQILVPADADDAAMASVMTTLMQKAPDVVVSCVYRQACHAMLRQMEESQYTPKALIMTICVTENDFMEKVGQAGKYTIGVAPWMPSRVLTGPIAPGWTGDSFSSEYTARYGARPPYQAASAFVAAATMVYAIESAGTIDPASVASVLRNMDTQSMYGQIGFDASGQCMNQMQVLQFRGWNLEAVFPPSVAEGSLVYPKPDWASLQCFNMVDGSVSRFGFFNSSCVQCPLGRMSVIVPSLGFRACQACPPGQIGVDHPECIVCPTGTFSALPASTRCENCRAGSFGNSTGLSSCRKCSEGTVSEAVGSSFCTECPGGYYQEARGQTLCKRCEKGRYGEDRSSTACQDCPATFSTDGTGFRQASDCGCPSGYFNGTVYDPSRSPSCEPCGTGISCPGFNNPLRLQPGYYEAAVDFNPFRGVWQCNPASKCPGGPPGTCAGQLEGIGCSLCPDGKVIDLFNLVGPVCRDCDPHNVLLVAFFPFALLFALVWVYYMSNGAVGLHIRAVTGTGIMLGQSVTTFQVIGMFGRLSIPWPGSLRSIKDFAKVFTSDGDALTLECMVGQEPLAKYAAIFSVPFIAIVLIVVMTLLSHVLPIVSSRRLQAWSVHKVFNAFCHAGQAIFITITVVAASPFQCESHPNGKSTVVSFGNVRCFDGHGVHDTMMVMSIALLAFIVFPFLAISAWGSYSVYAATQLHGTNAPQLMMYRYLIYRFRPSLWWWGNVFNLKQLLLGLTPLITPDDTGNQLVYALFIMLVYLVLSTHFRPWQTLELNFFDEVSTSFALAIGVVMTTFLDRSPYESRQGGLLLAMVVFTIIFICFGSLYCLWQIYSRGWNGDYGFQFPLQQEMDHFSDHCKAAFKKLSELPPDEHRKLMRSLTTFHRLDLNRVITMFSTISTYGSEFHQHGMWNFQKALRLVQPAQEEQKKEDSKTEFVPLEQVHCVAESVSKY